MFQNLKVESTFRGNIVETRWNQRVSNIVQGSESTSFFPHTRSLFHHSFWNEVWGFEDSIFVGIHSFIFFIKKKIYIYIIIHLLSWMEGCHTVVANFSKSTLAVFNLTLVLNVRLNFFFSLRDLQFVYS